MLSALPEGRFPFAAAIDAVSLASGIRGSLLAAAIEHGLRLHLEELELCPDHDPTALSALEAVVFTMTAPLAAAVRSGNAEALQAHVQTAAEGLKKILAYLPELHRLCALMLDCSSHKEARRAVLPALASLSWLVDLPGLERRRDELKAALAELRIDPNGPLGEDIMEQGVSKF